MLKIGKKLNNYRSKEGFVFVYEVKGTVEEVKEYNESDVKKSKDDNIFIAFSPLEIGTPIELNYSETKWIAKQDLEELFEKQMVRKEIASAYVSVFGKKRERVSDDAPIESLN